MLDSGVNISALVAEHFLRHGQTATLCTLPRSWEALAVARHLRENLEDPRPLREIAALFFASPRTIERQFVAETGMSVNRWRRCTRLEAAAAMIRSGLPIETVAPRVGYRDASGLRRAFKAEYGLPPSQCCQGAA